MREYYEFLHERLTDAEYRLCITTFVHRLGPKERKLRADTMRQQMRIDLRWGFLEYGVWAFVKRYVYAWFIHPKLRRRTFR